MSTTIKEEKLMKKITSLILAIVMMLSMTVVSVYAAENTMPLESVTDVASTYSTDDRNLADANATNEKISDMKQRVAKMNSEQPDAVISIHQNSYTDSSVKGAQVFYYSHSREGEAVAKILQESLQEIDPENHRQAKANETYYLLRRTKVPTVIVECGFLTNPEEAEKLSGEEYQEQVAEAVAKGIAKCLEYLNEYGN